MTYRTFLERNDVPEGRTFLLYATGFGLTELLLRLDEELSSAEEDLLSAALLRVKAGEPLQYVFKKAPFYGFWFRVDERVLIPRFDSEIVVNEALKAVPQGETVKVLDLCTGSGCLGLAIALKRPKAEVLLSDLSEGALEVARENRDALGAAAGLLKSDLFQEVRGRFDVIVSNPPYIRTEEIGMLDAEVRDHEPRMALDGGADGLGFYRRIAAEAGGHLRDGGKLFLEIGYDEGEAVSALLRSAGFSDVLVTKDLAGKDRVVSACSANSNN